MSIATKLLKLLPPERAHSIAKWGMKERLMAPGYVYAPEPCYLFGVRIDNPLGLAAGFDKNGELVGQVEEYGFGFMEVGSVTRGGCRGNPKPRLFRLGDVYGDALLNRMGLNGERAYLVAERLSLTKLQTPYGVNIAKTPSPDIMGDLAIEDIKECYRIMRQFGFYHVINISCPNTAEGKTFEDPAALRELLTEIRGENPKPCEPVGHVRPFGTDKFPTPLLVKFSPTLSTKQLQDLVKVCCDFCIDGYVCCNTLPHFHEKFGKGGLSGPAVFGLAKATIKSLREMLSSAPIIACGGISTGHHMKEMKAAGADAFQAYAGFVHGPNAGPRFAHKILKEYYA